MKRIMTLLVGLAALATITAPVSAQDSGVAAKSTRRMVKVYITNISKQVISPPVVASHDLIGKIFTPGGQASPELTLLAEDGDPTEFAASLEDSEDVYDVAVADGPLMPGATVMLEVAIRGKFDRISAVGMLVTTNDGFFGLDSFVIDRSQPNQSAVAPAWDAGTEFNNELCAFIPGPPCGSHFVRDTAGAEGFIHTHPGISGVGDLSPADWQWQNPVVTVWMTTR